MSRQSILDNVQNQYGAVARSHLSNDLEEVRSVAQAFGYSVADLDSLPPQANMGLSCGNPLALAALRPGEVVVDLGCGGGLDVLLAAQHVGPTGKVIGIDMTPEMLDRARAGAAHAGVTNVEFHLAQIDKLPIPDASVDCVISNCVINLVPDKAQAFREILRVLKPGGRIAISDIALKLPLPPEVASDVTAYVGCIAGAMLIDEYRTTLLTTGFAAVVVQDAGADLNIYSQAGSAGCCSALGGCGSSPAQQAEAVSLHEGLVQVLGQFDANVYAASVRVHALKPQETTMKTIEVYDQPMCCSTGVCGPEVDPALPRFAADLDWLKTAGHKVERYNLAQQPLAFTQNADVHQRLATQGTNALPIVVVAGRVVSQGRYPTRGELAEWAGTDRQTTTLPTLSQATSCCGGAKCC